MSQINPEFVERYQLEYQKNPKSKVFAPLAEAYRKMGLVEEAHRICKLGVGLHPEFAGGRVAFAKTLIEMKKPEEALTQLEKAIQLSPDNLLAHSLMGETLLELRRPKDALKAFKMVLFLNPSDERARQAVSKWEFLTAEEYDEEVFSMRPIFRKDGRAEEEISIQRPPSGSPKDQANAPSNDQTKLALERAISLADAFTVRNDLLAAMEVLEDAKRHLGPAPEIDGRLRMLAKRAQAFALEAEDETEDEPEEAHNALEMSEGGHDQEEEAAQPAQGRESLAQRIAAARSSGTLPEPQEVDTPDRKRQILESFLRRINDRRLGG